jgi:hypothetical protein
MANRRENNKERALAIVANWLNDDTRKGEWVVARVGSEEMSSGSPDHIRFYETVRPILCNLRWVERFTGAFCGLNYRIWDIAHDNAYGGTREFSHFWNRIQMKNGEVPEPEPEFEE